MLALWMNLEGTEKLYWNWKKLISASYECMIFELYSQVAYSRSNFFIK